MDVALIFLFVTGKLKSQGKDITCNLTTIKCFYIICMLYHSMR